MPEICCIRHDTETEIWYHCRNRIMFMKKWDTVSRFIICLGCIKFVDRFGIKKNHNNNNLRVSFSYSSSIFLFGLEERNKKAGTFDTLIISDQIKLFSLWCELHYLYRQCRLFLPPWEHKLLPQTVSAFDLYQRDLNTIVQLTLTLSAQWQRITRFINKENFRYLMVKVAVLWAPSHTLYIDQGRNFIF